MEVVSAVASVTTLVALAKEIWTIAGDLVRNFQNAPKELIRISNQTSLVYLELECVNRMQQEGGFRTSLTDEETWIFQQSLTVAKNSIVSIHKDCKKYSASKCRISSRFAWTIFDSKTVDVHMAHLQRIESSITVILQVLNMKTSMKARDENETSTANILQALKAYHEEVRTGYSCINGDTCPPSASSDIESTIAFRYLNAFELPKIWKSVLGSEMTLITSQNDFQQCYEFYTRMPFVSFTGRMSFILSLSLRRTRTFWPNFSILAGHLNFANVVPVQSEIVNACKKGDLIAVRDLFRQKKAAPTDVSEDDRGLLWFATQSGSVELVRFLVHAGAPVRPNAFLSTAYWRQPEILRLLLHTGANVEVLGVNGFTAASFLYGPSRDPVPQTEYLEVLACNSFSNFNAKDHTGWTALHRAAAFGTSADVKTLLRMKASIDSRTYSLKWTPLFCAVCFYNMDTLQELWTQHNDPTLKDQQDLRGWNLLHIAAGAGNFEAALFLLQQGVDQRAASRATSRFVPPALRDRCVTPGEVARNCGEDAYKKWTEALSGAGHEVDVRPEDIDWGTEDVDGKLGGCECCENWGFYRGGHQFVNNRPIFIHTVYRQ
ncbi:ankyrin [Aaosphaeria arxii CBS 175.79]|uniref:Ankyrin n=1 Tax=Aaosphaeria arxii CBS 175.79 TaxID=1450172 RepID=A0A6A5Y3R3_9PLEO|nr:ankyrin [Aaosphaeria arxii CBS 175.79]KAF2019501.1 ankyrin [Aaosphaeria arxii CBS 175.79]